jgi:hypothetical protein
VNQSLKDLIDQFAKQRAMVESGQSHLLEDIFPQPPQGQQHMSQSMRWSNEFPSRGSTARSMDWNGSGGFNNTVAAESNKYVAQLKYV